MLAEDACLARIFVATDPPGSSGADNWEKNRSRDSPVAPQGRPNRLYLRQWRDH